MARWRKDGAGWPRARSAMLIALLLAAGLTGTALYARGRPQPAQTAPAAVAAQGPSTSASGQVGGYAGVAACVPCHADQVKAYRRSLHAQSWDARTPAADHGCETCHGPSQSHIDDPGAKGRVKVFAKMAPREVNAFCLTCHNRQEHEQWEGSMHDARNVSCINCHSVMAPKSEAKMLKQPTVTQTCAQCHREKAAKLLGSGHMPVREGKMECTTCHNQHGSTNVRMLRTGDTINELCTSCHAEKRGPFLWEHPPVRESCATCHDPHGSTNDRLLVAKVPYLCQRCHVATQHPASIYDTRSTSVRFIGRGCVNCHTQIHGSNHPSGFRLHR